MRLHEKQKTGFQPLFGANLYENGVLFSFASRGATGARLLLYDHPDDAEPSRVLHFDETRDRLGDVWRLFAPDVGAGALCESSLRGFFTETRRSVTSSEMRRRRRRFRLGRRNAYSQKPRG